MPDPNQIPAKLATILVYGRPILVFGGMPLCPGDHVESQSSLLHPWRLPAVYLHVFRHGGRLVFGSFSTQCSSGAPG